MIAYCVDISPPLRRTNPRFYAIMNCNDLESMLDAALCGRNKVDNDGLRRQLLHLLSAKDVIIDTLTSLMVHRDQLARLATTAACHPNGYDKFLLVDRRPKYALHLHIWSPVATESERHVHDHPWDFTTILLCGTYEASEFFATERGTSYRHYRLAYQREARAHWLTDIGDTRLAPRTRRTYERGESYSLEHQIPHRIVSAVGATVATLMLHGRSRRRWSNIYAMNNMKCGRYSGSNKKPMNDEAVRMKIRSLCEAIVQA